MKAKRLTVSFLCLTIGFLFGFSSDDQKNKATWVWQSEKIEEESEEILDFSKRNNIDLIYLRFDMTRSFSYYRSFIREAYAQGIKVHAVAGHPAWALEGHQERMLQIVDWVKQYNEEAAEDERIHGIQLDIEPYLLPEWEQDRAEVVRQWQANIRVFTDAVKQDSDLETSAAMAFWLDEIPAEDGEDESLSTWMIRQFDTLVIMAYRDKATGPNGILSLIEEEMEDADRSDKKMLVAVNLKHTDEAHTTFAEEGIEEMEQQLGLLPENLEQHPSYWGVAIHDYRYWQELAPEPPPPEKPSQYLGTYIWRAELLHTEKEEILAFTKEHDINLLYIRIDMSMSTSKYRDFIKEARAQGIEVHAMGGHPIWALEESQDKILRLVKWVKQYNESVGEDERFEGVHLDIEPYVMPIWRTDKEGLLRQWMANIEAFVEEMEASPKLKTSVDLAAWLDNSQTPGHADLPFSHWMISQLDHTTMMAFRDFAEGSNGILKLVDSEIKFAESIGKEVIVAVEMKESHEGEFVSFYEEGKEEMMKQLDVVSQALQVYSSFKGIAVHAYEYWKKAKE
jgi:hypothetical protein